MIKFLQSRFNFGEADMIVVAQVGQYGKASLLLDMHRLRKRVFKDRLNWPVHITALGLEVDNFDLPETIYLLSVDTHNRVVGSWRLLPSTGPTMIRDVWPHYLESLPMPSQENVWEVSRFAVAPHEINQTTEKQINLITAELFCGLTELCMHCGIEEIFTLYDIRIARMLSRLNCQPHKLSEPHKIDGVKSWTGCFKTDDEMLKKIKHATGIVGSLVDFSDLPPCLEEMHERFSSYSSQKMLVEA